MSESTPTEAQTTARPAHPARRARVVVAGLGDTGVLIAGRLSRTCDVVGISTRPALLSGQELGTRLTDPALWAQNSFVPFPRFRRLDRVRTVHGRISAVDLDRRDVTVEQADGAVSTEPYDVLVIATGTSNGFWRHDRVQDLAQVEADLASTAAAFAGATTVAVVGGGPTGVSVASNLARRTGAQVHLFHSGELPLPDYHPRARAWMAERLAQDGVTVHPAHRARLEPGFRNDRIGPATIEWTTGQPPFPADLVLWAVGGVRPHTAFLPAELLDAEGFVRVDDHLRVTGHPEVFAVGDVAASDPLRSSARNWGWKVVVANVRAQVRGRGRGRTYRAPKYRWGSVLGLQDDGLVVVQPNGRRFRFPRRAAASLLYRGYVPYYLYGGLRRSQR